MRGAGDQLDVDVGVLELLCRIESTESRPDDDDTMPALLSSCGFWMGTHGSAAPDGARGHAISVSYYVNDPAAPKTNSQPVR